MTTNPKHRNRVIILTLIALLISVLIVDNKIIYFDRLKDGTAAFPMGILFFFIHALLIGIVIYSIIQLIKKRTFGYLLPLVPCLIHFVLVITIRTKIAAIESSPIVMEADYFDEIHGLTLYLRQNKTYKLRDYGYYGGTNHYGDYRIISDTILLSEKYPLGKKDSIMSNKLLIKNGFILIKPDSNGVYPNNSPFQLRIIKNR